jgi:hypothetical protein
MNHLSFKISPSKSSNDHETRILIDGIDILLNTEFSDALGLDPVALFAEKKLFTQGHALIGRCVCGCVGCCDEGVEVIRGPGTVQWHTGAGTFSFNSDEYDAVMKGACADTSWETPERTAERLVNQIDFSKYAIPENSFFEWASARCGEGKMVLSFKSGREQKLINVDWDPKQPPQTAVEAVLKMLEQLGRK